MLKNFFELNPPGDVVKITTEGELDKHLLGSNELRNATIDKKCDFRPQKFENRRFDNVRFSHVTFKECTFEKCVFNDCLFVGTRFIDCEFHRCEFRNCNTHKIQLRDIYLDPKSFQLHKAYRKTHANIGLWLFEQLFRAASDRHHMRFSAVADVERRRWRRYQLWYEMKKERCEFLRTTHGSSLKPADVGGLAAFSFAVRSPSSWAPLSEMIRNGSFALLAKYGYGPMRFAAWTVASFLLLGLLAYAWWDCLGFIGSGTRTPDRNFLDALYLSLLFVTTLGFVDVLPTTVYGKAYAILCAIFGISWMALFTAILVRRVIR